MSVEDVDSMAEGENDSSKGGNNYETKERKPDKANGFGQADNHVNIPPLSSHLPLCLTAKRLPHSLPVYCGGCSQNGVIISQDALQPGLITSCTVPLTMTPMTFTDPAMIPSVIGPPSMPVASLSDLPPVPSMKFTPEKDPDSPGGDECECRWLQCNRRFTNLDDLVNHVNDFHVKVERPDVDYQCKWTGCPRLGKGFNARYKMLIHIRTHTNEKPHRCGLCGKCFSRLENLKIHNRSHTGEKPYVCPFEGCNKAYSNSSDRFKHVRTHQEEKPYICKMPGCNKRYTDPSSLRKHVRTIGHYFRGEGRAVSKLKKSSSPSPVPSLPISNNSIITLASSNGILGSLPPPHFIPLTSNIFQVSNLQPPFSPPVVTTAHCTTSTVNSLGVSSVQVHRSDSPSIIKACLAHSHCQDGPLDLSRSLIPQTAKDDVICDSTEEVQVD